MQERGTITLNFPAQVKSITSGCLSQTVTTSGQYMTSTDPKDYTFTCKLEEGYKISGIDFTDGTGGYNSLSGFTDDTFTISISSHYGLTSTVGINVSEVQKVQKSISLDNLAQFKANCDQTYAKVGESNKGGYQDQEYIDSRFDVGSLTYTFEGMGSSMSIPANYYYQKGSVDPNTVAISGTIDISVSGSVMLSVPFTTYAEFYCALHLCFEAGSSSGIAYDLEVQCDDIQALRSNIQTYWAFPYDFSIYKYPNAPYVYSDYGVTEFDIKIEENGGYISSGFHKSGCRIYYEVNTTGFIKNVDSKYKINFTSYSNALPAPAPGYAGQVPVVNAAGNGYELQAQGSGGGITLSQVIAREETLPTATADSPDFVEVGGVLYRKKAVEGGNLLGTWVWNSFINSTTNTFNFSFTSNNTQYTGIEIYPEDPGVHIEYLKSNGESDYAATGGPTVQEEYKTIQITDTSALTNEAEFTSWLTANATKQGGGVSVTYEYVAQQDAGASGGGTKLYCHKVQFDGDGILYHVINNSNVPIETLQDLKNNQLYIVGRLNVDTSYYPVVGCFNGVLVYIAFTGGWTGVTGANFATKDVSSVTSISDIVVPL